VLTGESITFIIAQALAVIYCSVCGMKMNFPRAVVEERCVITRSNFAWWVKIMDYRKDSRLTQTIEVQTYFLCKSVVVVVVVVVVVLP